MLSNPQKKKITVRISPRMREEMLKNIFEKGYGVRGKSHWIDDSLHHFNKLDSKLNLVEEGAVINQAELTDLEAFYLSEEAFNVLEQLMIETRRAFPLLKGVQSVVIRACIIARLIRYTKP